jgi:hypothetical protein
MMTASKRVVDGVILPVAPHATPIEGTFKYYSELWIIVYSGADKY